MASAYTQPTTSLAPLRMSYDEWQTWLGRNERNRGEWVDGEVVVFAMPKHLHQAIMFLLARLMAEFVEAADLGEIAADGTEMWLPERRTARLPDVFFVSAEHRDRLVDGPGDVVGMRLLGERRPVRAVGAVVVVPAVEVADALGAHVVHPNARRDERCRLRAGVYFEQPLDVGAGNRVQARLGDGPDDHVAGRVPGEGRAQRRQEEEQE